MPSRRTLIAAMSLTLLAGGLGLDSAQADTVTATALYVNAATGTCNDSGPGTQAEPFCQIQAAANAAQPGDTVYISEGSYAPVTITSQGTAAAPVSFVATGGGHPYVTTLSGAAITLSGAQYVNLTGINAHAAGTSTVVVDGSQHISVDTGSLSVQAVTGATGTPAAELAVDGDSADVSVTRTTVSGALGWGIAIAGGAQDVTLASDSIVGASVGAVQAVGASALHLAGDTLTSDCGDGVSLTSGTSGSVENTVAVPVTGATCTGDSSPAEISVDASSAAQVTADYNAVNPLATGTDYNWSGSGYATSQAFQATTGQGAHDLDQTTTLLPSTTVARLSEGSHLIDSANADALGELSTDVNGQPRLDDPLVADTGSGGQTYYDRGAVEFQDPLRVTEVTVSPNPVWATDPVVFTAMLSNPWSDSGLSYAFDFGDGTTAGSTTGSATHTYAQSVAGTVPNVSVTVETAAGQTYGPGRTSFEVNAVRALSSAYSCDGGFSPLAPDSVRCAYSVTSHYPLTTDQIDFGDGSAPVNLSASSDSITHTYPAPGHYTATEKLADDHGRTYTTTSSITVGPAYVPTGAIRVLDTRYALGAPKRPVGSGGVVRLKIAGTPGIPASGVSAIVLNLTDTDATADSFVTAYPDGTALPTTSNLNFKAGQTNANLVTVPVSKDGYVDLYNRSGKVDLIADVEGYYTTTPNESGIMSYLVPTAPTRVLDTRYGVGAGKAKLGPNSSMVLNLPQARDVATDGALINLTVTGGTADSYLTIYCGSTNRPTASTIDFRRGQTVSNLALASVCNTQVEIYNHAGSVDVIADLQGLYTDDLDYSGTSSSLNGGPTVATAPTRILDTRYGVGAAKARLGVGGTITLKVAGVGQVPADARAVLVNLTGVAPTVGTYLTAYGAGARPSASNLSLDPGESRPILALVPVDANGCIHLYNHAGSVDVIADLEGYVGG